MGRLATVFFIAIGTALLVEGRPHPSLQPTETVDTEQTIFSSGGLLELKDSVGEVQIEGWDHPEIEIVLTKSSRKRSPEELDRVLVTTERSAEDHLLITTKLPFRNASDIQLRYQIKVPRMTRLAVAHQRGAVQIRDVAASMRLSNRFGPVDLTLPDNERYTIDAKARFGAVQSDWSGYTPARHTIGPIYLQVRVGTGNITLRRSTIAATLAHPSSPVPHS